MGKKRKELSPMDALFQELGRLSRDGKADEALLAFDRAKADLSGPFEPRVYHKLLALRLKEARERRSESLAKRRASSAAKKAAE